MHCRVVWSSRGQKSLSRKWPFLQSLPMKIQASSPLFFFQRNREYKKMRLQLKGKKPSKFLRLLTKLMKLTEVHTSPPLILGLEKDLVRLEVKVYNLFRLLLTSSNPTLSKKNFKWINLISWTLMNNSSYFSLVWLVHFNCMKPLSRFLLVSQSLYWR